MPEYGKLIVYEFPKDELIYGPFQIRGAYDQNTDLAGKFRSECRMGSQDARGILLVVPIGNSILYVSPLYLRAQSGQLPELKRVTAAYGDRVVMEETLQGSGRIVGGIRPGPARLVGSRRVFAFAAPRMNEPGPRTMIGQLIRGSGTGSVSTKQTASPAAGRAQSAASCALDLRLQVATALSLTPI